MSKQIIGIMLVKNEEYFVEAALKNALEFCDRILVLDNMSTDSTFEKLSALAAAHPKIQLSRIRDFGKSHQFLEEFAGTDTWVFKIDGDEIYDKARLSQMRERVLRGEFDDFWAIKGHALHVVSLDFDAGAAFGYATPPARSLTSLHNFGALISWREENKERLHGRNAVFKPGYHKGKVFNMHETVAWTDCDLKCLHVCFMARSSLDPSLAVKRKNPAETKAFWKRSGGYYLRKALTALKLHKPEYYKDQKYKHGAIVQRDLAGFDLPNNLLPSPAPIAAVSELRPALP